LLLYLQRIIKENFTLLNTEIHAFSYGKRFSGNLCVRDIFDKQKMIWESDLSGFSNVDKIIKHLDYGMFIPKLFEKGLLT